MKRRRDHHWRPEGARRKLFGDVHLVEGYGMTEPWPFGGTLCAEGHLHFEPSQGLLEVLDIATGEPAQQGAPDTLVLTPLHPFRETTTVLRYDTQDVVRLLATPAVRQAVERSLGQSD